MVVPVPVGEMLLVELDDCVGVGLELCDGVQVTEGDCVGDGVAVSVAV